MVSSVTLITVHHFAVDCCRLPVAFHAQLALRALPLVLLHTFIHHRRHTDTGRMGYWRGWSGTENTQSNIPSIYPSHSSAIITFPTATSAAYKQFRFTVLVLILRSHANGAQERIQRGPFHRCYNRFLHAFTTTCRRYRATCGEIIFLLNGNQRNIGILPRTTAPETKN